ncbi:hypothetical protein CsSME_00021009 [Camellia sinensis var. sinensis]
MAILVVFGHLVRFDLKERFWVFRRKSTSKIGKANLSRGEWEDNGVVAKRPRTLRYRTAFAIRFTADWKAVLREGTSENNSKEGDFEAVAAEKKWNIASLTTKIKGVNLTRGRQFEVRCGKLEGAILERYKVGTTLVGGECMRTEWKVLDVQPLLMNVGASFNCWQVDSSAGVHVEKGGMTDEADIDDGGSKFVTKLLFLDLLDLSTTQPTKDADPETVSGSNKMSEARDRVAEFEEELRQKSELECKVTSMERALGSQAANLCMGFNTVISLKNAKIARLNALLSKMKTTIARLEDQVDEYEAHEFTAQCCNENWTDGPVNNTSNVVGSSCELNESCNVDVDVVNTIVGGHDVMVGRNDGVVNQGSTLRAGAWSPTEEKGKCNSDGTSNAATAVNNSNIKHVLDRPGSSVVDRVIDFVNIEEPNITSLVRHYPGLVKRCKQSKDKGNIGKNTTEDVINIEDDEGRHKTWAGFGMKN